ncbi:hypothetical protein DM860_009005 [Cuscuta australis]|uniref:Peroxidase n=1 Tax=Cuscuta australis TaxID=267555 RepID=A0A328DD47_9ASTE|nr:hypothetical protein DM860_009005 [Cuscuta australis]
MVRPEIPSIFSRHFVVFFVVVFAVKIANSKGLELEFYRKKCPNVEGIVKNKTGQLLENNAAPLAAALLRMHFHDCFVRGCDGSVLINSTSQNKAEKDAIPNQTLRGWNIIGAVKSEVEKQCPGVVSCADILALVARDAVALINGPSWEVPLGRRDGKVSSASEALQKVPSPLSNFTVLKQNFADVNLTVNDLALLSGAHTIGRAHCFTFTNRLYNFTGNGDADPSMHAKYVKTLKKRCPPGDTTTTVEMDPGSAKHFDDGYYRRLTQRRGLLSSDAALVSAAAAQDHVDVKQFISNSSTTAFFRTFGESMVRMGKIGVLTGTNGEIRKVCSRVN